MKGHLITWIIDIYRIIPLICGKAIDSILQPENNNYIRQTEPFVADEANNTLYRAIQSQYKYIQTVEEDIPHFMCLQGCTAEINYAYESPLIINIQEKQM